jgi:hypothetical protein
MGQIYRANPFGLKLDAFAPKLDLGIHRPAEHEVAAAVDVAGVKGRYRWMVADLKFNFLSNK